LLDDQDANLANVQIDIQYDMAPVFYIDGHPAPGDPVARSFARATAQLRAVHGTTAASTARSTGPGWAWSGQA
jgi:hypothetical protein